MIEQLRTELLRRADRDQEVRHALGDSPTRQQWDEVNAVDLDNYTWLAAIVDDLGWPDSALVSADGAYAAWLIAQHAPLDHQQNWLPLLRDAVERGNADPINLAYLDDRVRCREQRPQRYGTQWLILDGRQRLQAVDDPAKVNLRRVALGLPELDPADIANAWPLET